LVFLAASAALSESGSDLTPIHGQDLGVLYDRGEEFPVGSGHPGLGAKPQNFAKKRLAAGLVQMGSYLIQKDEGRDPSKLLD